MDRSIGTGTAGAAHEQADPFGLSSDENEKKPSRGTTGAWCGNCAGRRFRLPPKRRTLQMMLVAGIVFLVGIALSTVTFLLLLPNYSSGEQANFNLECVILANNLDKVLSSQHNLKVRYTCAQ